MITVSSRDGREVGGGVLGVGRGTGGDELEEGEAFSFPEGDDDDDRIIDPDIALSYIDEKIKNLLGHVQKDFEGGVSAENLGAKFGGYGSFLPMYQRSPVLHHSKSPIQTKKPSVLSPPRRSLPEGNQFPPTFSSSPSHIRQHYTSSCNIIRTRDRKSSPSQDNVPVKVTSGAKPADACNSTILCYKNISPRNASKNNPANPTDQKMLKLRIKVGSDNILTQKNAEIYSGLGLDVSPSSSLGSPQNEGFPQEPQTVPCVSPVSILQIMTTFLEDGERLLSPLSDDLLHLIRKENTYKEDNEIFNKGSEHFIPIVRGGATPVHDDGKIFREKRPKSEKKSTPSGLGKERDVQNEITVLPKEMTTDQTSDKKQVSDFSTFRTSTNTHFDSKGLEKPVDDEFLFHMESSEGTESDKLAKEESCYPNRELCFSGNIGENKRTNAPSGISTPPLKNAYIYSASDSLKTSLNNKELRNTNHENVDPPKPKPSKKSSRREKDRMRDSNQEHHGGNYKSKKPLGVDSYTSSQKKNKFHLDGYQPKEKSEYTKKQIPTNSRNGFSNFPEEPNIGEDDELGSLTLFSVDREEDNDMPHRNIPTKEKVNNKNTERSLKSEASLRTSTSVGSIGGDRSNADAPLGAVVPAIIKENWVCCDKCQKWRLLPPNTNPEDLPEKWLCSMLNWLPGMNRCSISEDETTKSLFACYYQTPNANLVESQNCDPNNKNNSLHALSNEVKKKNTTKSIVSTTTNEENSSFSTHPEKVSIAPGKSRSLYDEKYKQKLGEKRRMPSHSSDSADIQLTTKSKKVLENDYSRIIEQTEECMNVVNGDSISGNPNKKKANSISDNGCSSAANGKSGHGNNHTFPKDLKLGAKDGTEAFEGKRKPKIYLSSMDQSVKFEKAENTGVSNKKKDKVLSVNEVNSGPFSAEGNQLNGNNVTTEEETSDVVRVKEKKQKYVKSERMESNGVKYNVIQTNDIRLKHRKVSQVSNISAPSHDSAVVLSSPSKIKRSHKNKVILWEHKSSPVGSISSSPLMISNPDKAALSHRKIQRNGDLKDATGFVDSVNTEKCSLDDEFSVRNNPLRLPRMDKNENSAHPRSVGSPVLDFREVNNNQLPVTVSKQHSENPYEFTTPNIPNYSKKASAPLDREQINENRPQEKLKERNKKSSETSTCYTDQVAEEKKRRLLIEDSNGANKYKFPAGYDPGIVSENPVEGRSSKRAHLYETSTEPTGNGKCHSFPVTGSGNAKLVHCQQQNESKSEKPITDKRSRRDERQNKSKKVYESVCGSDSAKEHEIRGFVKKEVSSQVINNALGEAKNLKHMADRLKNSGLENESRGIYFQAALKFLHSASMSEFCSDTSNQPIELYRSTAKFCQFCAHEFERAKDMASVSLAYKCTEVASLRVIYCSYTTASRDCHELQMAPLTIIPGESPCSSASDVDNVNNNLMADKAAPSKGTGSPRVLGNHVIAARNRPNFLRLLNFSQDVQFAMDCSRRSQAAFAAAVAAASDESGGAIRGFSEIKKALDFGFQDVDELLHLIRVAIEAMVQQG